MFQKSGDLELIVKDPRNAFQKIFSFSQHRFALKGKAKI